MTRTAQNKISFIIASVDREEQLQQCISSIEKAHEYNKNIPIEILVVIQKAKQKKDIHIRFKEITTFYYIDKLGLSVARNFAISKSTGEYLVFLDDDAMVNENFIDVLSKNILIYSDINAFCGRLIDHVQNVPFSPLFANKKVKKLGRLQFQYFMGSAHILSKKVINKIGGYDERFGVGAKYPGGEESDMFFRLIRAREQVIYLPDIIFFHPIPVVPSSYVYKYSYAFAAVITKHLIEGMFHFAATYFTILFQKNFKALIRVMQKALLRGKYEEKDKKYHYSSVLKGMFDGIKDYIKNESWKNRQ